MPRPKTQCEALTVGQLAKRWGIGREYARDLADQEEILEAFTIPSAGCHGRTTRIPLAAVLTAQQHWANHPEDNPLLKRRQRRQPNGHCPNLRHFPELNTEAEDAAQCPEDAQGLSGSNV
jgi:hypothetical protein